MNLELLRTIILSTGWPVLVAGTIFLLYKAIKFNQDVNKVVFGKMVVIMTAGWLFTMYCLGAASTAAMMLDVKTGVYVVFPIFAAWAMTMVIITIITLRWSKEAVTINEFYQDVERKYQSIFELSPEAIVLLDTAGVIIASNDRLQDWMGYKTNEIVGKNIMLLPFLTDESKAAIMKSFSEKLLDQESPAYDVELVNKKGQRKYGQVVAASVKDEKGKVIRNLTMISDVTEKRNLENLREDLRHMIVHDLKNPLVGITNTAELFLDNLLGPITDKQRENLQSMLGSSKKLSNLIMDILQVKSIEEQKMKINKREFQAEEMLKNLAWLNNLALGKKTRFETQCQPGLTINGDPDIITRVIENLASNAIKHTPREGSVALNIREEKDSFLFEVVDTGEGIPREYQDKIFDKFFKVKDQTLKTQMDTGLGLTFCKLAVEAMGCTIGLDSEVGKGSRFYFTLPN
ncbi:MAG: PAS domain-containing sensor histidine kinase [Candidatus Margulisiibacteriota bacterium]